MAKRLFVLALLALLVSPLLAEVASDFGVEELVARVKVENKSQLDLLAQNRFSVDHHPHEGKHVDVYGTAEDIQRLSELGIHFELVENEAKAAHILNSRERVTREVETTATTPLEDNPPRYYNYQALTTFLQDVSGARCPNISRMFSIGLSTQNREILGIEFSDNPGKNEPLEPELKLIANIHGDETVGRMVMIYFIDYICTYYGQNTPIGQRLKALVDSTSLHIIPSLNPDGFERGTRSNANGIDLNRDFPDQFDSPNNTPTGRQKETQAMMQWTASHNFVLSASYHGGAVVANYPFDGNANRRSGVYAASPDDSVFKEISLLYSKTHASMSRSTEFTNGITNGAEWYVLYGGMQDWNYLWYNALELTLEISNTKYPSAPTLTSYWNDNLLAILKYSELVNTMGVRGVITDSLSGNPIKANITIPSRHQVFSDATNGDYYKLLTQGTYQVTASAVGYVPLTQVANIPADQTVQTRLDFALRRVN